MTNNSHIIMYGDQCPVFEDIKIHASSILHLWYICRQCTQ